jgi:hypothetical protein
MAVDTLTEQALQAEIDRELRLLDSAIAMVRRGVATRVTVANLQLGTAVLESARARARVHRLRVTPVWSNDDSPGALVVDAESGDA